MFIVDNFRFTLIIVYLDYTVLFIIVYLETL